LTDAVVLVVELIVLVSIIHAVTLFSGFSSGRVRMDIGRERNIDEILNDLYFFLL